MTTRTGHVLITNDRLSARCEQCQKSISYRHGQPLDLWNEELAEFRNAHRDCKKGKTECESR